VLLMQATLQSAAARRIIFSIDNKYCELAWMHRFIDGQAPAHH